MRRPTKSEYSRIQRAFLKRTKIKVVNSTKWYNIIRRRLAERVLNRLGVKGVRDLLATRYIAVTLGRRRLLFAPRPLGSRPIEDLCLLAHEYHHFRQVKSRGLIPYLVKYFFHDDDRVHFEMTANLAEVPVRALFGRHRTAHQIFTDAWQKMYKVSDRMLQRARNSYITAEQAAWRPYASQCMIEEINKVMR